MPISESARANFETLKRAFNRDDVALMECRRRSDGAIVNVICACTFDMEEQAYNFTPFAEMASGNPFELYDPPAADGGFEEGGG